MIYVDILTREPDSILKTINKANLFHWATIEQRRGIYRKKKKKLNRKTEPEIDPHKYSQFVKEAKIIQWNKDSLFNTWCWNNCTFTRKENESRHRPPTLHKN